jgi:hypothetical protein
MRMTLALVVATMMLPLTTASHAPARTSSCDSRFQAISTEPLAAAARKGCGHGIKRCSAAQVGLPCNPGNLNIICSAQGNGSYCCLAYAP